MEEALKNFTLLLSSLKLCAEYLIFVSITSTLGAEPWSDRKTEGSANDS